LPGIERRNIGRLSSGGKPNERRGSFAARSSAR
jgi:hypothetical protein